MTNEELKAFYFKDKYDRIDKELAEKERQWIADCRARMPKWSEPRPVEPPCDPEEHIERTAQRGLANWLWACIACYAVILGAFYLKYWR